MIYETNYSSTRLLPALRDYGCRNRLPHDLTTLRETSRLIVKQCKICGRKVRFKKSYKGRTDNRAYLIAHARNFAQPYGRTKRLYQKIHDPKSTTIHL